MPTIVPLAVIDPPLVEDLLDAAFGDGRQARTAYRIRDGMDWLPGLSFAALDDDDWLVATIQLWPVALTDREGKAHPLLMVGPVAVMPGRQGEGYGKALMATSLGAIGDVGGSAPHQVLPQVLIGDLDYYRQWDFGAAHTRGWRCPGPWDPNRLLVRAVNAAVLPREGMLGPWPDGGPDRREPPLSAARISATAPTDMPYDPPPELAGLSLAEIAEQVRLRKLPPVEQWNPEQSGDSDMRIAADGTWYHDGGPVTRQAMVRAFSGLLRREDDGGYWLVTPFQKLSILVEDACFTAVDCQKAEDGIAFRLNTDELVVAGPDHPIRAAGDPDLPALYVMVRRGCEARLNRSTYEQLAQIAMDRQAGEDWTVESGGETYTLRPE